MFISLFFSVITLTIFTFIAPFYIINFSANMFSMNLISTIFWAFIINYFFIQPLEYNIIIIIIGISLIILGTLIFNYRERIKTTIND